MTLVVPAWARLEVGRGSSAVLGTLSLNLGLRAEGEAVLPAPLEWLFPSDPDAQAH